MIVLVRMIMLGLAGVPTPDAKARVPAPPSATLRLTVPGGIKHALEAGNSKKLAKLGESNLPPLLKNYVMASYYRSIFDIKRSSHYAEACSVKSNPVSRSNAGLLVQCGTLLAGNYIISGNIAAWASTLQVTRDRTYSTISRIFNHKHIIYPGYGKPNEQIKIRAFRSFPRTKLARISHTTFTIARVSLSGKKNFSVTVPHSHAKVLGPYFIRLNVNGHSIIAALDTGTPTTVMVPSEAKALGIHVVSSPFYSLAHSRGQTSLPTRLGYAYGVMLGGRDANKIQMRNVDIMVGGKNFFGQSTVVGMNIISKLGEILIEEGKVVVHPDVAGDACETAFSIASTPAWSGSYQLLLKYPINGNIQHVLLDTGSNQYLSGTANAKVETTKLRKEGNVTETGTMIVPFYEERVLLGNRPNQAKLAIKVYPGVKMPWPYTLGLAALRDFNIYLNFPKHVGCLIPRLK